MARKFEIKNLGSNDVALTKQLFLSFQIDDGVENPTEASDGYLKKLLERPDFHVIAAVEDERVIGGLTAYEIFKYKAEETEMFLYEISVESAHRKKGVATALVENLKQICAEKNIREMFVGAEADNLPALQLYEKTGGKGFPVIEFDYELE
jgi:aminoglycoside 3-N-acetyltransferase I